MVERKRLGQKMKNGPRDRRRAKPLIVDEQGQVQDPNGPVGPPDEGRARQDQTSYPSYDAWSSAREEPVDAETEQAFADRAREQWRRTRDRAREYFGAGTKARIDEHEEAHGREEERAGDEDPEMSQRDQLLKLRAQTRLASEAYMTSLAESNILAPGFEDKSGKEAKDPDSDRLEAMRSVHTQMMIQNCIRPLSRGVNSQSVIQAVGMMSAMTLLSKNFREEVGEQFEPLKAKIQDRIDTRARSHMDAATRDTEARVGLFSGVKNERLRNRLTAGGDPRNQLSKKWRRRFDELERRERGNRELYTPEIAAMTEIGLMENAFQRMREPNADHEQIAHSYRAMRAHVRGQFDDDGLARADVVGRIKLLVGARMEHEPELKSMFVGLGHGFADREMSIDKETGQERWTGDFTTCAGVKVPYEGRLAPRPLMDSDSHRQAMAETMQHTISSAYARQDGAGLRDGVFGYMVGFAARKQGLDSSGSASAGRAETMMASMEIDGLSEQEQRNAYSMAYVNAMEEVAQANPEFDQTLAREIGPDWQQRLQAAVDDPGRFMAEEASRSRPRPAGPGPQHQEENQSHPDDDYQPA